MIDYNPGTWGILFIFQLTGSVFPKALPWAVLNAVCGALLSELLPNDLDFEGFDIMWSSYTFVLGFLIVFRNNQAYTRFWEGGTLVNQMRGEWMNATSSLMAFCNDSKEKKAEIAHFQHLLIRLMSMLHCCALQQVADLEDDSLEIISTRGLDHKWIKFLEECPDRCEVIVQWIQRLIVVSDSRDLFMVAPPVLSRAFQEISRGIVNLSNARKIREIPFPFPYAQIMTCMLLIHWVVTPLLASYFITETHWVAIACFCVTASLWSLLYIAMELDQPFGNDPNDLPLELMQREFNEGLQVLLRPLSQVPPDFTLEVPEADFAQHVSTRDSKSVFVGHRMRLSLRRQKSREQRKFQSCQYGFYRKHFMPSSLSSICSARSENEFTYESSKVTSSERPSGQSASFHNAHSSDSQPTTGYDVADQVEEEVLSNTPTFAPKGWEQSREPTSEPTLEVAASDRENVNASRLKNTGVQPPAWPEYSSAEPNTPKGTPRSGGRSNTPQAPVVGQTEEAELERLANSLSNNVFSQSREDASAFPPIVLRQGFPPR